MTQTQTERLTRGIGAANRLHSITFLPEPERRRRYQPIISVDDHVVEPAHMFEGRVPAKYAGLAPHIVENAHGDQEWIYGEMRQSHMGLSAVAGRPLEEAAEEPSRFEHMRKGAWDPRERVLDMDLNGIYASLNFPSALPGFAGQRLQLGVKDPDLALSVVRAWNDWYMEEWVQAYPERFIPLQLPWMRDPEVAAAEIRRNAERGFRAVTFTEGPHELGLPTIHSGYWDPFIAACAETETVLCLHVGSSSTIPTTAPDAPIDTVGVLFFGYAMFFAVDWLYSMLPVKYPDLKICMSEGGIGWVCGLLDRLEHVKRYQQLFGTWANADLSPADVMRRNFWFCAIDDAGGFQVTDRVGIEHLLVESDYPHLDSLWPNTQAVVHEQLQHLPEDAIRKISWENGAKLFHHPVPEAIQKDPELFSVDYFADRT